MTEFYNRSDLGPREEFPWDCHRYDDDEGEGGCCYDLILNECPKFFPAFFVSDFYKNSNIGIHNMINK